MRFWFGKEEKTHETVQPAAAPVREAHAPSRGEGAAVAAPKPAEAVKPAVPEPVRQQPNPPEQASAPAVPESASRPQVSQRDLYCNLMNALYDAVLVLDDEGHIVDSNNRVEAIFGYAEDDLWDRPAKDLIKGFGPQLLNQISVPLREHRPVLIDGSCVRKDGTVFAAEIAVGSVRLARGENIVLSIRDVGKRMAAIMDRLRTQGMVSAKPSVVRLVSRKESEKPSQA